MLLGSATRAQRLDGTLRVTVMDHSQATIESAQVTVENEATGVAATTTASSAGAASAVERTCPLLDGVRLQASVIIRQRRKPALEVGPEQNGRVRRGNRTRPASAAGVGLTGTAVNFVCNAGPGGATSVVSW